MNLQPLKAWRTFFGYDAVSDKKKRTAPRGLVRSEDDELSDTQRKQLLATARDQFRNYALCGWLLRTHLDYVSRFNFQSRTDNPEFNRTFERLVRWWSRPENCDIAQRHGLDRMTRLVESSATLDGDVAVLLLRNGRLQAVEADRIVTPPKGDLPSRLAGPDVIIRHGLVLDEQGRIKEFLISSRNLRQRTTQLKFERAVRSRNVIHHGYFTRFDQVRGVSPLAAVINQNQDLYEVFDYQMLKLKFHAMFGLAIKRNIPSDSDDFNYVDADTGGSPTSSTSTYDFNIKPGLKMELDPGDEIDVIESRHPSSEFLDYSQLMIQISNMALDIPMTFFDSRKSSYSAQRQDLLKYVESAKIKRDNLKRTFLDRVIRWKMSQWLISSDPETGDPMLALPEGMKPRDVAWEWIPVGIPWIDPLKEINAHTIAIGSGLKSRQQISAELGLDFETTLQQLAEEEASIVESGVTVQLGMPGAITTREEETQNPANEEGQMEDI